MDRSRDRSSRPRRSCGTGASAGWQPLFGAASHRRARVEDCWIVMAPLTGTCSAASPLRTEQCPRVAESAATASFACGLLPMNDAALPSLFSNALAKFAARGVTARELMTDNAFAYKSRPLPLPVVTSAFGTSARAHTRRV